MKQRWRFVLLVLIASLQAQSSRADIITITMHGTVEDIGANDTAAFKSILPFQIGDAIAITASYDSTISDTNPSSIFGRFQNSGSILLSIVNSKTSGTTDFQLNGTATTSTVNDHATLPDRLTHGIGFGSDYSSLIASSGFGYANNGNVTRTFSGGVTLEDSTKALLASDQLPTQAFSLSDLTAAAWRLQDSHGSGGSSTWTTGLGSNTSSIHRIEGNITSFTMTVSSVPEPSFTMPFGIILAFFSRWRKHQ